MRTTGSPWLIAISLVAALAQTAGADADSLTDHFGPREISVGESMRGSSTGAKAITLNPAGLSLSNQLVFEGSYGFRPEDSAQSVSASACDSTVPIAGCFYYNYFAAEPVIDEMTFSRRVHQVGWTAARSITQRISIGTNTKYFDYNTDLMGEEDQSGFAFDAGVSVRPAGMLSLGVVGYNLLAKDTPQYPLGIGAGISLQPSDVFGLSADAVWNLDLPDDQTPGRYGGGAEFLIRSSDAQSGYPLRAGVIHDVALDATYVTGGIGFINPRIGLDVGARQQVDGGDELMVLGSLRLFGGQSP